MIVVFVVDTSPSMGETLVSKNGSSLSKLDLAKMTVESLVKMMERRVHEHNMKVQSDTWTLKSIKNLGFGLIPNDQFLLLSTGCQRTSSSFGAAGGRLLVGFGPQENKNNDASAEHFLVYNMQNRKIEFDKELKNLKAADWNKEDESFPKDGGGALGLNAALSQGLQLLSRHRLQSRCTENFGLGRLPSNAVLTSVGVGINNAQGGGMQQASNALQPACLILLSDGECLRKLPSEGGGQLQLQFGNLPLREFYQEPFRWDQRVCCLGIGSSVNNLHPSLRAFCDVSGGMLTSINSVPDISQAATVISRLLAPKLPQTWPLQNPLRLPHIPPASSENSINVSEEVFVNGGPVCAFQVLERASNGQAGSLHRAMLLYSPSWHNDAVKTTSHNNLTHLPPLWCIPEKYFPSKKLESLPPRKAQPLLHYTRFYQAVDTCAFDPHKVMQMLHRLDHFIVANRLMSHGTQSNAVRLLQRDIYICHWLDKDGRTTGRGGPSTQKGGPEHFPIFVNGAGRSELGDGNGQNALNIGILHISNDTTQKTPATLTLLPPEPHILIPLLLKAAEVEHRQLKKAAVSTDDPTKLLNIFKNLLMDEGWRSEMRAYLYRVPPYYHPSLRRCLRVILPPSVHNLLNLETAESAIAQCLSRTIAQKIRNGEQISKATNDRQEQQEGEYRRQTAEINSMAEIANLRHGQFDCRSSVSNFLNALRHMPPPKKENEEQREKTLKTLSAKSNTIEEKHFDPLGDLPAECLLPFYESRRRWIFGGDGLTTKGLFVEGVHNKTNSHYFKAKRDPLDESLLAVAGVGASALNKTSISKMGDFKERLLFTDQPIIGYGSLDSAVSPISTAVDGSPISDDISDDSLPSSLFNAETGEFDDSPQARLRTRLMVNFGNPYKEQRGNKVVPSKYADQRPPSQKSISMTSVSASSGSPPHGKFSIRV